MTKPLTLTLTAENRYIPIVRSYAEMAALAIGLGNQESLALALAAEEIFSYLCNLGRQEDDLTIKFYNGIYYARIDFQIKRGGYKSQGIQYLFLCKFARGIINCSV